tara:strand:+ start:324 stop:872 length:549 start_codon:yes stop_codon:yes gene_type:complete
MTGTEYRIATKLVRGGFNRSAHKETSEALYLTSGFVYSSAEEAAAAFRDEADVFVYSRYGNPTVKMFEDRLALLEGQSSHPQHALAKKQMSGFGSLLAFELDGGEAVAFTLLNNLQLIDISNNLGDSKSLACHPYTTTHSSISPQDRASLGITAGHIRLSVGMEDCDDLIDNLDQALAHLPG